MSVDTLSLMSALYFCSSIFHPTSTCHGGWRGGAPSPASNKPGHLSFSVFSLKWRRYRRDSHLLAGTPTSSPGAVAELWCVYHSCSLFHAERNAGRHTHTLDDAFWHRQDRSCAFTYAMTQISIPLYTPSTPIRPVRPNKRSCAAALTRLPASTCGEDLQI